MSNLIIEGEIACTFKGERQTVSFSDSSLIPDIVFAQGEIFRFSLEVQKNVEENPLTRVGQTRHEGDLSFRVFLSETGRIRYNGGKSIPSDIIKEGKHFRDNIHVNEGTKGSIGMIAVDLFFKRIWGA